MNTGDLILHWKKLPSNYFKGMVSPELDLCGRATCHSTHSIM